MSATHIVHPRIVEHGLVDGCDRCAEMAVDPFNHLDNDNLRDLMVRTRLWMKDRTIPRSDNELAAMRVMEKAIIHAYRINQLEEGT